MITIPELLQPQRHARRLESYPLASVDKRVGAEGAAKGAALGGDVVELSLALEREIALHGDQPVVVRAESVDGRKWTRWVLANGTVGEPHRAAGAPLEGAPFGKASH